MIKIVVRYEGQSRSIGTFRPEVIFDVLHLLRSFKIRFMERILEVSDSYFFVPGNDEDDFDGPCVVVELKDAENNNAG